MSVSLSAACSRGVLAAGSFRPSRSSRAARRPLRVCANIGERRCCDQTSRGAAVANLLGCKPALCPPPAAATDIPSELRSLEVMRKFSEQYAKM